MRSAWLLAVTLLAGFLWPAAAQQSKNKLVTPELEKTLSDVNQQWLCAGSYYKPNANDCVNSEASIEWISFLRFTRTARS